MKLSEVIKKETWNGGHWLETHCTYGFYSISINPKDDCDENPRLIVVIDDPDGEEKPFIRMIPDIDVKDIDALNKYVDVLYESCGIKDGEVFEEYQHDYSIRKWNFCCWQVLYKGEVVGEYDTPNIARKNIKVRIETKHYEIEDELLQERERWQAEWKNKLQMK